MENQKLGKYEAIFVICIICISNLLLSAPQIIITICGSSSIINAIYISALAFIIVSLIYLLFKKFRNFDILDIANYLAGNWFKIALGLFFIFFIIMYASMPYRDIADNLKIIYFPNVDISYILIILIIPIAIVNYFGFNTVLKCNTIILPFILLTIILIFIFNIPNYHYENIFPILGNGPKNIFFYGICNIFSFTGFIYLYFIIPTLKDKTDFKKVSFLSTAICSFFIILTISSLIFIFPTTITKDETIPIYLATKQISFGTFLQRTDILFILTWILTIFSNLSVAIAFCLKIFQKITNITDIKPIVFPLCAIFFSISLMYSRILELYNTKITIFKNGFCIFILGFTLIIMILANIKKLILQKGGEKN